MKKVPWFENFPPDFGWKPVFLSFPWLEKVFKFSPGWWEPCITICSNTHEWQTVFFSTCSKFKEICVQKLLLLYLPCKKYSKYKFPWLIQNFRTLWYFKKFPDRRKFPFCSASRNLVYIYCCPERYPFCVSHKPKMTIKKTCYFALKWVSKYNINYTDRLSIYLSYWKQIKSKSLPALSCFSVSHTLQLKSS